MDTQSHKNSMHEASDQLLRAIVESSDDAIISKNLDGTILSWNKGAERIFGYTQEDTLGKNIIILIPDDRRDEEQEILSRVRQGGKIDHYQTVRICKDGSLMNISLSISPIRNSSGEVIGASKIARRLNDNERLEQSKKKVEEELAHERNQLRTLIDNIPAYIYFKDKESRFIDANKATMQVMKCKDIKGLIGKTDFDFYPKEYATKYFADEVEIIKTGVSKINIEETLLLESGKTAVISTSKVPLKGPSGDVIGLVGVGRDITEQIKAQEVLERDNENLEIIVQDRTKELLRVQSEFDKSKRLSDIGTLAAIVGHELRHPLDVIKMAIHHLKKDKTLSENKYLINIEKKLWEGHRIIDNLLNYSRIKAPFYESVNLRSLVDECVSSLPTTEEHQIVIEKKYGVPENTTIEIDPYQIKEVFINIFNNACQALSSKNGKVEVIIQPRGDRHVGVFIKDNGVGIDESDLHNIFIPFFTSKVKGTGLGLAICKELVDLHHGKIEVESQKGQGTTFRVILPLKRP